MNEKGTSVLESYDFEVIKTSRVRGAVLCDTSAGTLLLKEYTGTPGRLYFEEQLLEYIYGSGMESVDRIIRNRESELCTHDSDGTMYIVKRWFQGRECDVHSVNDVIKGAGALAGLHEIIKSVPSCVSDICRDFPKETLAQIYERHNRELKKIRSFLRKKRQKSDFEVSVLGCYHIFYEKGEAALGLLDSPAYKEMEDGAPGECTLVHGNFNYHNVIFTDADTAVTNFDKAGIGMQMTDFYTYLRKVMEKHQWDVSIGNRMLEEYSRVKPITDDECKQLKIMIMYPEKFWKILNYYYNSSKAWTSARNMEKLNMVKMQEDLKGKFIDVIFS